MPAKFDHRTFIRLDEGYDEHPKVMPLSDAAFRAHVEALDGLVVEYLMLGWSRSQISFIFESPHYAGLRWITREIGAERVRARVRELCDQWSNAWIAGGTSDAAGL